ncbi:protein NLP7-like [Bidens hawaiensis]|uniref:protein NLP7-like n=1 Tax=Bidens hawaiensis TaxID=980011 RepID=UPI0040491361
MTGLRSSHPSISEFLQGFPNPPVHYIKPDTPTGPWLFWNNSNSSSAVIDDGKLISSLFASAAWTPQYVCQFWAPVTTTTIGGQVVLSTSGQPFGLSLLSKDLAMYMQYSETLNYDLDEHEHTGPATAFRTRFPCLNQLHWILSHNNHPALNVSIMLPICSLENNNTCIAVLELTGYYNYFANFTLNVIHNLKKAGLYAFSSQDHIPYQTINLLKHTKHEIDEALKAVCRSHDFALAQVWIPYVEETQKKRLLALKLTGCSQKKSLGCIMFPPFCDAIPFAGEEHALKTLQDHQSRYILQFPSHTLSGWDDSLFIKTRGLTICLRSEETGDLDYVFEFIWTRDADHVLFVEGLLLRLKLWLPSFKFASGAELSDELDVKISTREWFLGETREYKIFQGRGSMKEAAAQNLHGNEERERAIQAWTLTLEAEYEDDIIEFHLPISQASFVALEKEISVRLRLAIRTYKLEYFDEDGDQILLTCDEEMGDCIRCPRSLLCVIPSLQPI